MRRVREAEGLVEDIGDSEPLPFVVAESVKGALEGLVDQLMFTALGVARDRLRGEMASVNMRVVQGEEE